MSDPGSSLFRLLGAVSGSGWFHPGFHGKTTGTRWVDRKTGKGRNSWGNFGNGSIFAELEQIIGLVVSVNIFFHIIYSLVWNFSQYDSYTG